MLYFSINRLQILLFFRVDQQFSGQSTSYTLAEAQAIMEELRNIQKSLSCGEKEKVELMQVCMKWCIIIIIFTIFE